MNVKGTIIIHNCPPTVDKYQVARLVDGEFWHYAQFSTPEEAQKCAGQFENGIIITHDSL